MFLVTATIMVCFGLNSFDHNDDSKKVNLQIQTILQMVDVTNSYSFSCGFTASAICKIVLRFLGF